VTGLKVGDKIFKKIMKKNNGFTFIEVLIVVAIIGILASIILVGLSGFRNRGRDTRRVADLREVQNGLELYYTKNGVYPDTTAFAGGPGSGSLSDILINAGIGINVVPDDPNAAGSDWHYGYCRSGTTSYVLGAHLEDSGNSNLSQYQAGTNFPCLPTLGGNTPGATEGCSTAGSGTNKYCVVF